MLERKEMWRQGQHMCQKASLPCYSKEVVAQGDAKVSLNPTKYVGTHLRWPKERQ